MVHASAHSGAAVGHAAQRVSFATVPPTGAVDHAVTEHGIPESPLDAGHQGPDHGAMQTDDHAATGHGAATGLPPAALPRTAIPALTDVDRAAAFPQLAHDHALHDGRVGSYWRVDRLEWADSADSSLGWEAAGWLGGDLRRLWLRSEGEAAAGEGASGHVDVLHGRSVSPWWDVVAGARHRFGPGPSRTYVALGVQGVAPFHVEVEATAFIDARGRGGATLEAEYDMRLTNRLILQWQGEATLHARSDRAIGTGAGLSSIEAGARLRYEVARQFAPYVGVQFERTFGSTADVHRRDDGPTRDRGLVAGFRVWF